MRNCIWGLVYGWRGEGISTFSGYDPSLRPGLRSAHGGQKVFNYFVHIIFCTFGNKALSLLLCYFSSRVASLSDLVGSLVVHRTSTRAIYSLSGFYFARERGSTPCQGVRCCPHTFYGFVNPILCLHIEYVAPSSGTAVTCVAHLGELRVEAKVTVTSAVCFLVVELSYSELFSQCGIILILY